MPKPWSRTPEQEQYLTDLLPKFVEARTTHRIERFKNDLYDGWFKLWPEEKGVFGKDWKKGDHMSRDDMRVLGAAIEKRKEQLYNYVRWHTNGKVIRSRTSRVLKKFINKEKTSKRSRKYHKLEIYSKKFYETRFKDQVEQEILDTTPPNESTSNHQKRKMSIYRKWRSLSWQMESDEVKAEIEAIWKDKNAIEDISADEDPDKDAEGEPDLGVTELPSYGGCVDELGELITSFLRELQNETGWAFTILGGGLNREGEVKIVASHVGKTVAGSTFPQVCNNYQANVLQEFLTFVKVRHPIEERLLCAQVSNERNSSTSSQNKETSQSSPDDNLSEETACRHDETSRATAIGEPEKNTGQTTSLPSTTSLTSAPESTLSSGYSMPMASGPIFNFPNADWTYNSPTFATPVAPKAVLPPAYENLSPMSKFLVDTAPNHAEAYDSIQNGSTDSSSIFYDTTNIALATMTSAPVTSVPMNATPVYPASTVNNQFLLAPTSIPNLVPYYDLNAGSCPSPSIDTLNYTLVGNQSVSLTLPSSTEPEDRATETLTNIADNNNATMLVKPRKRARKDEVDMSFALPDGATRAHKPRCLGDETYWEGIVPKRLKKK